MMRAMGGFEPCDGKRRANAAMIDDAAVFSILSKCFVAGDEAEWAELTAPDAWAEFLDGVRLILQNGRILGDDASVFERMRAKRAPLQDFLAQDEVDALFCPPSYEGKCRFIARHFTGGLPESAMPVESLYASWDALDVSPCSCSGDGKHGGRYLGKSAQYMRALVERMGMTVPKQYSDMPDHLALELDAVAVMLRSGMANEARMFLAERFFWLADYRKRLLRVGERARFYVCLVDVIIGFCAEQSGCACDEKRLDA